MIFQGWAGWRAGGGIGCLRQAGRAGASALAHTQVHASAATRATRRLAHRDELAHVRGPVEGRVAMPVGLVHSASARDERLPHRVSGRFHGCVSPVKKHQEPGHLAPSADNVQSRQL